MSTIRKSGGGYEKVQTDEILATFLKWMVTVGVLMRATKFVCSLCLILGPNDKVKDAAARDRHTTSQEHTSYSMVSTIGTEPDVLDRSNSLHSLCSAHPMVSRLESVLWYVCANDDLTHPFPSCK